MKKLILLSVSLFCLVQVSIAQNDAINIIPNGNVGIGNTTPVAKLHIGSGEGDAITIGNPNDAMGLDGGNYAIKFYGYRDVIANAISAKITAERTNVCCGWLSQGTDLAFYTNNGLTVANSDNSVERLRIGANGTIKITNLAGAGNRFVIADASGNLSASTGTGSGIVTGLGVATRVAFWNSASDLSSNANLYWDNTNSRLGVGTAAPNQKLEIGANGGLGFSGSAPALNSSDKKLYSPADGDLEWMTHNSAGAHGFAVSHQGTKYVYLNTSGNSYFNGGSLGVGTTTPGGKLDVNGGALTLSNAYLDINRDAYARSGISWYSQSYPSWSTYMSPAGTASTGPHGDLTAPSGTFVTSWALRNYIENAGGYGWTFESAANTTTPAVKFEIRSSDGLFHSYGNGVVDGSLWVGQGRYSTYTWQNAAITTPSIEIVGDDADNGNDPILVFHDYGYGGPRFRKTGYDLFLEDPYGDYTTSFYMNGMPLKVAENIYNAGWYRGGQNDDGFCRFYGNSRQMVFRTDGTTQYSNNGGYPFVWEYGGDGSGFRRMILNTNGDIWTASYGWLHSYFAASAHTHLWSQVTSKPAAWLDGATLIQDNGNFNNSMPSGFYQSSGALNAPGGSWYNMINVRHSNTGNDHGFQIAMSYYDEYEYTRTYQGGTGANNGTFTPWAKHLTNRPGDWELSSNSTSTGYGGATLELRESNYTANGSATPPHLGFHWGGVVASNIAIESDGTIAIRDNPGTGYEKFRCLTLKSNGFIEPSDARLKKNITPISSALDKVKKMQGVTYNWRKDINDNNGLEDGTQYGLIAQELEKIIPELVHTDKEGWKSIEYSHLVPVLIEAIKEQQLTIDKQNIIINHYCPTKFLRKGLLPGGFTPML